MKIKIGNKIIDTNTEPAMLILSQREIGLISKLEGFPDIRLCSFPEDRSEDEMREFMNLDHSYYAKFGDASEDEAEDTWPVVRVVALSLPVSKELKEEGGDHSPSLTKRE